MEYQGQWERRLVWFLITITVLGAAAGMKITPELADAKQERFILFLPVALGGLCALAPVVINILKKQRIFSIGAVIATWCFSILMMIVVGIASCSPVANHVRVVGPTITANHTSDGIPQPADGSRKPSR